MKFKLIIFDLDGTIADTLPLCIAAFKKSVAPYMQNIISDEDIIATFGPSEEGTIRKLIPNNEAAGIKDYLRYYEELHYTCPEPFLGIKELLESLKAKGVMLGLVTGKGLHSTIISLKQFGLTQYFDIVETGSPDGPNKVNGIQSVLHQLNIRKDESLYVGDAPSDIIYCKEVGIPIASAAWATTANAKELMALNPQWLFNSVKDFRDWLFYLSY